MRNLIGVLLHRGRGLRPTEDERPLVLEAQIQTLRLELAERERVVAGLKSELERLRNGESARRDEATRAQMARLLTDVGAPVVQLVTQMHLLEEKGVPVPARDVLSVAMRLVRTLRVHGLTLDGGLDQEVAFDPARHEILSGGSSLSPGESVVVRLVGISSHGKILRKAGVARVER